MGARGPGQLPHSHGTTQSQRSPGPGGKMDEAVNMLRPQLLTQPESFQPRARKRCTEKGFPDILQTAQPHRTYHTHTAPHAHHTHHIYHVHTTCAMYISYTPCTAHTYHTLQITHTLPTTHTTHTHHIHMIDTMDITHMYMHNTNT